MNFNMSKLTSGQIDTCFLIDGFFDFSYQLVDLANCCIVKIH
jgi:hypothetical protein